MVYQVNFSFPGRPSRPGGSGCEDWTFKNGKVDRREQRARAKDFLFSMLDMDGWQPRFIGGCARSARTYDIQHASPGTRCLMKRSAALSTSPWVPAIPRAATTTRAACTGIWSSIYEPVVTSKLMGPGSMWTGNSRRKDFRIRKRSLLMTNYEVSNDQTNTK